MDLVPKDIPKGKEVVREGRNIGTTIELGRSAFCREKNVRCWGDYKQMCAEKGYITLAWPKDGLLQLKESEIGDFYLVDIGVPLWVFMEESVFGNMIPDENLLAQLGSVFSQKSFCRLALVDHFWKIMDTGFTGQTQLNNNTA